MKCLCVFFLLLIPSFLFCQSLVNPNQIWTYYQVGEAPPGFPEPHLYNYTQAYGLGDTATLSGALYHNLLLAASYNQYMDSISWLWEATDTWLREDSLNRVYLKQDSSDEILLYDFNLEVNDTFYNAIHDCPMILEEKDSVMLLSGEMRERFIFQEHNQRSIIWIEGIGDIFTFYPECNISSVGDAQLLCVFDGDLVIYNFEGIILDPSLYVCYIIPVNAEEQFEFSWKIYPNPAKEKLYIELENQLIESELSILDITGRQLYKTLTMNQDRLELDIAQFQAGIYYIQMQDRVFRFVKIE